MHCILLYCTLKFNSKQFLSNAKTVFKCIINLSLFKCMVLDDLVLSAYTGLLYVYSVLAYHSLFNLKLKTKIKFCFYLLFNIYAMYEQLILYCCRKTFNNILTL